MELTAQKRDIFGRASKTFRYKGLVPAELYGKGLENVHLSVSSKELRKVFKGVGSNAIVNVLVDGKSHPVLLYDVQRHPVSDEILSVDFYQVRLDEKVKVKVPVEFVGVSSAVKDKGGILVKAIQELEVEALPTSLPQSIRVDISSLNEIGQGVRIKDLINAGDYKILAEPEATLVMVSEKITEEKEAVMAEAVDVGAIKVETEEKKAERAAAKPAGEQPPVETAKSK